MAATHNPLGPKSDKMWRDAVIKAVKHRETSKDPHVLDRLAKKLVDEGLNGNMAALKEVGDRLDGKPSSSVDMSAQLIAAMVDITPEIKDTDWIEKARMIAFMLSAADQKLIEHDGETEH